MQRTENEVLNIFGVKYHTLISTVFASSTEKGWSAIAFFVDSEMWIF